MEKAALYCRVSMGNGKQTNENQKIRLLQYASEKNLKFDLYEEVESSRKTRPVKQALLQKLRNGEYNCLICFSLDRWGRSSTELVLELTELLNKNVAFISLRENLDFSSATGKLHFQILSAFAEFERELIRERTIEGLNRVRKEGVKKLGRPFGAKDRNARKKSGYYLREAIKKKKSDEQRGIFKSIEEYIGQKNS